MNWIHIPASEGISEQWRLYCKRATYKVERLGGAQYGNSWAAYVRQPWSISDEYEHIYPGYITHRQDAEEVKRGCEFHYRQMVEREQAEGREE